MCKTEQRQTQNRFRAEIKVSVHAIRVRGRMILITKKQGCQEAMKPEMNLCGVFKFTEVT